MRRIIAAIDNGPAASPVVAIARVFAEDSDAALEVVHVRNNDGGAVARSVATAAGVPLLTVEHASPAEGVLAQAEGEDAMAVVIGARVGPTGRRPAGHNTLEIVTSLKRPLLVVPPLAAAPLKFVRALVPLDGTRTADRAVPCVVDLLRRQALDLVALHVCEARSLPRFSDQAHHEVEAWTKEFLARHCRSGPRRGGSARLELRVGVPAEHILRVAEETRADLIALSWVQVLGDGRAAVVREILERCKIPLLLVPSS